MSQSIHQFLYLSNYVILLLKSYLAATRGLARELVIAKMFKDFYPVSAHYFFCYFSFKWELLSLSRLQTIFFQITSKPVTKVKA